MNSKTAEGSIAASQRIWTGTIKETATMITAASIFSAARTRGARRRCFAVATAVVAHSQNAAASASAVTLKPSRSSHDPVSSAMVLPC